LIQPITAFNFNFWKSQFTDQGGSHKKNKSLFLYRKSSLTGWPLCDFSSYTEIWFDTLIRVSISLGTENYYWDWRLFLRSHARMTREIRSFKISLIISILVGFEMYSVTIFSMCYKLTNILIRFLSFFF